MFTSCPTQLALNILFMEGGIVGRGPGEQGILEARQQKVETAPRAVTARTAGANCDGTNPIPCTHAEEPRAILVFNRSLSVQPLPVALFSNGHVSTVQRRPWKCVLTILAAAVTAPVYCGACTLRCNAALPFKSHAPHVCRQGIVPLALHATFVRYGTAGKVSRFR